MQSESYARIDQAVSCQYDTAELARYYDSWASQFNHDVDTPEYAAPQLACSVLAKYVTPTAQAKVVDIGCGTGLVGRALRDAGYENIYGFDLSAEMVAQAVKTGVY